MNIRPACRFPLAILAIGLCLGICQSPSASAAAPNGKTFEIDLGNNVKATLIRITAGKFTMGSPANEAGRKAGDEENQKLVTIANDFYMGETEVTQAQWKALMGTTPWKGQQYVKEGDTFPATYINWHESQAFLKKLSAKTGHKCRLPLEEEWEYACRAGTKTAFSFGNDDRQIGDYAWFKDNSVSKNENYDHQVKTKKPNAWGLYDMHGNAYEWCEDDAVFNTKAVRGGAWHGESQFARSACRNSFLPASKYYGLGLRILLDAGK